MELAPVIAQLKSQARAIEALVAGVDETTARWKPSPQAWSLLEVVNHLADEEVRDFRTRLDLTLNHPGQDWPLTDPEAWVTEHRYNERALAPSLQRFLQEREASCTWLGTLEAPDWDRSYEHKRAGPISARDLLASWVAHDLLHLKQLAKLRYAALPDAMPGSSTGYAGNW